MKANIKLTKIKRSPLEEWHRQHGAKMVTFGTYEMPLWYRAGAKAEHFAVLQNAGLFDTCHMSVLKLSGQTAINLLQECFSRDLLWCDRGVPLTPGRGVYGVFLESDGHLVDDAIIFQIDIAEYIICVNSGMGGKVTDHLRQYSKTSTITDLTGMVAKIDLQGPASPAILAKIIINSEHLFDHFPFLTCRGHFRQDSPHAKEVLCQNGAPILLSRSGYTGELGFEIFIETSKVLSLWDSLMDVGKDFGLMPCGLASRDSLRTGAVLPLAGHDIGARPFLNNPWQFVLPFKGKSKTFSKEFLGSKALTEVKESLYTYPFVGFDLRKIEPGPDAGLYDENDQKIGEILTCVSDMALARIDAIVYSINSPNRPSDFTPTGLCCGFVLAEHPLANGQSFFLRDKRRKLKIEIVDDIRPARTRTTKLISSQDQKMKEKA